MKVQREVSIFAGQEMQSQKAAENQKERKNVFAGNLKTDVISTRSMIQQKKEEAQKKALKIVGDAWEGDKTIEADMQSRRDRVEELQKDNKELRERVRDYEELQERLKENESAEGSSEEWDEGQPSLQDEIKEYQKLIDKNTEEIYGQNAANRTVAVERLKYAPMVEAEKQADEIKEAASDEIVGMIMEDAKDHVDEEQEKREEQAEEIKEAEEEKEELLEKRKEEKEEREELIDKIPMEEMISLNRDRTDVQKEVQEILDKMKLVAEDIKGAKVDQEV